MRYALNNFDRTVSSDGQDLLMKGFSIGQRPVSVKVKLADMNRYLNGALIQEAFPYLTAAERELCISGLDDDDWKDMFEETEEED